MRSALCHVSQRTNKLFLFDWDDSLMASAYLGHFQRHSDTIDLERLPHLLVSYSYSFVISKGFKFSELKITIGSLLMMKLVYGSPLNSKKLFLNTNVSFAL